MGTVDGARIHEIDRRFVGATLAYFDSGDWSGARVEKLIVELHRGVAVDAFA